MRYKCECGVELSNKHKNHLISRRHHILMNGGTDEIHQEICSLICTIKMKMYRRNKAGCQHNYDCFTLEIEHFRKRYIQLVTTYLFNHPKYTYFLESFN